jgi:hypothetical protein
MMKVRSDCSKFISVVSVNCLDLFLLDRKFSGFDLLCIAVRSDCSKFLTLVLCYYAILQCMIMLGLYLLLIMFFFFFFFFPLKL